MPIYFVIQIALRHKVFDRYTMNIMHSVTRFNAAITLSQNIEKKKRKIKFCFLFHFCLYGACRELPAESSHRTNPTPARCIPERNIERSALAVGGFHGPHGAHFFACLCSIPFIENIVERHHFKSRTRRSVYILLDSDKGYSKGRIYHLSQSAHFYGFSAEAGKVFYDNSTDFTVLCHSLHTLKIGAVESRTGNTVVYKKFRVKVSVLFGVLRENSLLIGYTVALAVTSIILGKAAVKSSNFYIILDLLFCHNKEQTFFIKSLTVDADAVVAAAKSVEIKEQAKKVYEAIRYADPMSNPALNAVESQIAEKFSEFASVAKSEDAEKTKSIAEELLLLIRNRNQKCKLLK